MSSMHEARSRSPEALLDHDTIEAFRLGLRGSILVPSDPDYHDARTIWNGMVDKRPALIVRCEGVGDVIDAVNLVRERNLPFSIRSGGHNIAGTSVSDGGVMIDLSGMKDIRVDQGQRSVRVRSGCTLGDVDHEAQKLGLVVPAGIVSETGIAGLTLGGGFGWLTRKYGYTSDNLLSADVVLADGRLVRASPTENEDLFWGICGGGGNFGVVTSLEYQAYPLGPLVMAGLVVHSFDDAASVIRFFREFTEGAPDEVCCLLLLRPAPPAPFLPTEVHGKMIAGIAACYVGSVEDGERALRPVMQFGNPIGHNLAPKPFISFQKMFDAGQPNGRQYYWKSEYVSELSPAMDETLIKQAGRIESPHSAILLFQLGGAMGRIDEERFAAGHRDANYIVNIAGAWDDPEESESHVAWVRDSWTDVTPFSTGGTYVNFLTGEEGEDRVRAAYGKNYDRLVEVKSKYDPDNLFKVNQNIRPGG